ncbi:ABC transporter ATP-binding protein [Ruminococcus flavefaciens]|uniref:ATP-binding cassette subfamily B protein n=1 Tax=Ruminococcus flavefaciens TaxID=1265 RepID=A0A315XXJ1_RUMFL|nr:ABC transporter ATP-binding protein [Ruminococcus flavefaciens]PWJ12177.1 ATP-binding cassette subfamily B protein [Ruminococcus flavefaciens]SSA49667.1 ATP-binding cassette, subfamily B [Ruminococcus flavefaciens]
MFKKVKPYMGEYIKYTYGALAVMFIALIASAVPFFLVYRIIKPLLEGEKLSAGYYTWHIAFIFICLLAYAILYVLGLKFSHISAYNTLKNIRISLQKKLERQPLGTIQDMGNGRIKKLFTDDIEQVEMLLAHAIPEGISNLAMAAIAIICMFFADWKLALLSLCSLPIGMFAMGMMFKAGMERMNDYYAASAKMNATIIEYINGMEVVKVFGRDGESYQRYEKDIKSYRDFTLEWYKICWPWMALYSAILPCVALVMLPVGTLLVINGSSTLADLVLVFCLSLSVGVPILKALNFAGKFPQLNYKIDEIEKAMDSEPLKTKDNSFIGNSNIVKFEDVHFAYKEQEVLHGVSLELKEGSLTALVGESGSGKSTLAKLLVHYYDINGGKITLGGQDITDMSIEALNDRISYVSQEQFLFNTTLYENILMGDPKATREQVLEAAEKAQCREFLERLPDGIDTMAGDGGKQLSGGERQRISLARAILKNAPVIVLDEATAFIDPENEEKMNAAIAEIIKGKTVLVIAHRLQTVVNADKICVMKDGNIIAADTHEKLLESCDEYKKLWSSSEARASWTIGNEVRA